MLTVVGWLVAFLLGVVVMVVGMTVLLFCLGFVVDVCTDIKYKVMRWWRGKVYGNQRS